jgi:hypothetical protein
LLAVLLRLALRVPKIHTPSSGLLGFRIPIRAVACWFPGGIMLWSGRLDHHGVVAVVRPDAYTLGVMLLRVCGDTAKDIEIVVLRRQLAVQRRHVNRAAPPARRSGTAGRPLQVAPRALGHLLRDARNVVAMAP